MKKPLVFLVMLLLTACASAPLPPAAPVILPGTLPEMNTPGYWISRHPAPDCVVMTPEEISTFNRDIVEQGLVRDIAQLPDEVGGAQIRRECTAELAKFRDNGYVRADGTPAPRAFFRIIEDRLDLSALPSRVPLRFALTTMPCNQRLLPTGEPLFRNGSAELDRLQNSTLDIGEPLAVQHVSADGRWLYALSPLSAGWIRADRAAFCPRSAIIRQAGPSSRVVVTAAKADLYLDPRLTRHHTRARMGVRLTLSPAAAPRADKDPDISPHTAAWEVALPWRRPDGTLTFVPGYVRRRDVATGCLPYTPRSIIQQAFALLNAPYGWGGMNGEQDCSRLIQQVFATTGVHLPRNSTIQSRVGELAADFGQEPADKRREMLNVNAIGGITTLRLPGHIMLFLGFDGDTPYVLHETWGLAELDQGRERPVIIRRAVVSDLERGRGTRGGSLLERLTTARIVRRDETCLQARSLSEP